MRLICHYLDCNSKLLWFDIYNQITDIIYAKNVKTGIISM